MNNKFVFIVTSYGFNKGRRIQLLYCEKYY